MALLEFVQLSKIYGDCVANKDISFSIEAGTIHGLIGENGAGKSTLMKMLFGLVKPTSGEIRVGGTAVHFTNPSDAKLAGIGMVHQHFMQAGQMTALEHLALEHASTKSWKNWFFPIAWRSLRERLEKIAEGARMPIPWDTRIEDLSVGFQQRIEILKLLDQGANILIFDEPTAVLSPLEIAEFLQRLRDLKKQGKTILLISHKLGEVKAVCDAVTVLRRGEKIWSGPVQNKNEGELAELMVGQRLELTSASASDGEKKNLLRIRNLSTERDDGVGHQIPLRQVSCEVHRHEIVGIAGVEGNGQTELLRALVDPRSLDLLDGSLIELDDIKLVDWTEGRTHTLSNRHIREKGVGLIAEDRLAHAVVPLMSVKENILLGQKQKGRIEWTEIEKTANAICKSYDVRPPQVDLEFSRLSGGNQQKVVVGREISANPRFLVAAHPTRGVDLLAIDRIHRKLIELRDRGCGILLISSELDELFRLSDRILVFSGGAIKAEFTRGDYDEKRIGVAMGGHA